MVSHFVLLFWFGYLKDTSDSPLLLRFYNLQKECYTNAEQIAVYLPNITVIQNAECLRIKSGSFQQLLLIFVLVVCHIVDLIIHAQWYPQFASQNSILL